MQAKSHDEINVSNVIDDIEDNGLTHQSLNIAIPGDSQSFKDDDAA